MLGAFESRTGLGFGAFVRALRTRIILRDCALIFAAIHGADGLDPAAVDRPFSWPLGRDLRSLRVGYVDGEKSVKQRDELTVLRDLGVKLVPIKLPDRQRVAPLHLILTVEAAAVFASNFMTMAATAEGTFCERSAGDTGGLAM